MASKVIASRVFGGLTTALMAFSCMALVAEWQISSHHASRDWMLFPIPAVAFVLWLFYMAVSRAVRHAITLRDGQVDDSEVLWEEAVERSLLDGGGLLVAFVLTQAFRYTLR